MPDDIKPVSVIERERIREQYDEVLMVSCCGKHHLYEDCQEVEEKDDWPKPVAAYPGRHLDLCNRCVAHWRERGNEPERMPADISEIREVLE